MWDVFEADPVGIRLGLFFMVVTNCKMDQGCRCLLQVSLKSTLDIRRDPTFLINLFWAFVDITQSLFCKFRSTVNITQSEYVINKQYCVTFRYWNITWFDMGTYTVTNCHLYAHFSFNRKNNWYIFYIC